MPADTTAQIAPEEYGLLVQQPGKPQQVLARFLNLMLNYQYGLPARVAPDLSQATVLAERDGEGMRCAFIIQNQESSDRDAIAALTEESKVPLFMILPEARLHPQKKVCADHSNVYYCAWQKAFSSSEESLQWVAGSGLEENGIGDLLQDADKTPYSVMQQRVERRMKGITTLPTLPEIIMRIMRLVNDPKTTTEEMERVLCTDPAIVIKLLQVMRSPIFAGTVNRGKWTLGEIVVRLGLKKVGAIAQQIKMINSLVKPEASDFDLRRFWWHSVGSAIIADKLYTERLIPLKSPLDFNEYWVGALLHDVGKLVLGFFFWDWFSRALDQMQRAGTTFRQAEARLGGIATHERVGQLLLTNANMGQGIADTVGTHHTVGEAPGELTCLVHMADNLAKELDMGYLPGEEAKYEGAVLNALSMQPEDVDALKESLAEGTADEVRSMVEQCL